MSKRGLPDTAADAPRRALRRGAGQRPPATPIGRMVPIDLRRSEPDQPRQVMGDLSELMASIAEKGIIEPLIVRQRGDRYQIIAGERRYQAAVQVGPRSCRSSSASRRHGNHRGRAGREHPAQGPDAVRRGRGDAVLAEKCGYTHEELARRLGKSRTAITESLSLARCPTRSEIFVGWPTFPLSHCFYR